MVQIVSELPVEVVGRILAAARPTADACGEATLETARAQAQTLGHLLLLMPPACHPAVLAARFPGLTADGTLVLPRMPVHAALDDSCPTAASLSVHALAAAALFADGCPAAVWSDFSAVGDATKLSMRPLPLERLSASQSGRLGAASSSLPAKHQQKFARLPTSAAEVEEAEAHVAGELCAAWESTMPPPADAAWLTRLHFEVPVCQSSRWCSALAQLRTLCSLHLHVAQVHDICVAPFAWALRALPSLSDLQVTAERAAAIEELCAVKLLQAVAGVTQLSTLHMHQCYSEKLIFRRTAKSPYPGSQLSCLTALTELVLSGNELKDVSIRGLCCAVACMPRLRRLSLMNGWHAERVVVALGHVRHAALHSLELVNSLSGDNTVFAELSREPVIQALTRLTALSFAANHMPFWIWHKVPDILRRTPMLLSLVVQESLQDSGLLLLASLLPGLRYLIRLDISNNYATYMGVSAVLAAAAAVQASGGAGLRCLAMHATQIGPTNALQLADLLLQLPTLEEVGMQHTGVPFEATMELIHELCGLPRLQSLALSLPRFTGAGARKLAPAIARLPSLRRLTLQGVRLSCVSSVHGILVNGSPGVSVDLRDLNGLRE